MKEYLNVLRKYFVFRGRARRREFWMFYLFHTLISLMLIFVYIVSAFFSENLINVFHYYFIFIILPYHLAMIIPYLTVSIRRLHDINCSGWYLLMLLIPYLGIFVILILNLLDGQAHENKYGPNPKGEHEFPKADQLVMSPLPDTIG
jgi:uncharacterized membrane protein YhaH (DUF805 family)